MKSFRRAFWGPVASTAFLACSLQLPSEDEFFRAEGNGGTTADGGATGGGGTDVGGADASVEATPDVAAPQADAMADATHDTIPAGGTAGTDGGRAEASAGAGGASSGGSGGSGGMSPTVEAGAEADAPTVFQPKDGLILHYTFNESSGTLAHDSAGEGDGFIVGSAEWISAGRIGRALRLPGGIPDPEAGTGSYVELPQAILLGLQECTIATWFNWDAARAWERVFDFGNDVPVWIYFTPRNGQGLPGVAGRRPDPQGLFVDSLPIAGAPEGQGHLPITQIVRASTWTHLAVTWTAQAIRVYLDGKLVGETVPVGAVKPTDLGNTTRNWIGRSQFIPGNVTGFVDPHFGGMVDDFRIYSRSLSASEVSQLHALE